MAIFGGARKKFSFEDKRRPYACFRFILVECIRTNAIGGNGLFEIQ